MEAMSVVKFLVQIAWLTAAMDEVRVAWSVRVPAVRCQQQCGNVTIPFPFGIGEECSFSKEFEVACNYSFDPPTPRPNSVLDVVPVVEIDLLSAQVQISLNTMSFSCILPTSFYSSWWISLSNRPFTFSNTENVFVTVGCNTTALVVGSRGQIFGCTSQCSAIVNGSCTGSNGCCQTAVPNWLKDYNSTDIQRSDVSHTCSYCFMVKKNSYNFTTSDLDQVESREFPVVIDWIIGNRSCTEAKTSPDYACLGNNSYCVDSINGRGYVCNCSHGNLVSFD